MKYHLPLSLLLLLSFKVLYLTGQAIDTLHFNPIGEFEYAGFYSAYTALPDQMERPYLYTASNELGLVTFDISDPRSPIPVDTILPFRLNNLKVSNLYQAGNLLYAALGGFQGAGQKPGLAIFDLSQPDQPALQATWDTTAYQHGSAIVIIEGNYAYLGLMRDGLLILDISDKDQIRFVSHFLPDVNWPRPPGLFSHPNARGMAVRNDTVFICNDAGGLRLIDVHDKENPLEIAKYLHTDLDEVAQPAYNNIVLKDHYAFLAVDYCGLEVIDFSDPDHIHNVSWYNPWNCNGASWAGSPGHMNQLAYLAEKALLFVSGGDSEVLAFDISDPTQLKKVGEWVNPLDSAACWGVSAMGNQVFLSFIDNSGIFIPGFQPFYSNFGGIKILEWETLPSALSETKTAPALLAFPNPTNGLVHIQTDFFLTDKVQIQLFDQSGRGRSLPAVFKSANEFAIDLSALPAGLYYLYFQQADQVQWRKLVKTD
ncbi:MAG: T9SS type A sorting domain-containing protein [Saprospiraceae bacterium]